MPASDITLVAPYPPPDQLHGGPSGVASYTANLARSLHQQGAKVRVIAPRQAGLPPRSDDHGVDVLRAFDRGPAAVPSAARTALATGSPVVHLQHEAFLFGGPAAVPGLIGGLGWLSRRRRTVVTMHQVVDTTTIDASFTRLHRVPVPVPVARGVLSLLQGGIPRLAAATVVLEDQFRDAVPGSHFIPHGVEQPTESSQRQAARTALGLGPSDLMVLAFGFIAPYKGLEAVLEAAEVLAGQHLAAPPAPPAGVEALADLDQAASGPAVVSSPGRVAVVVAGGAHPRLQGRDDYEAALRDRHGRWATFTGYVPDPAVHPLFAASDVVTVLYPRPFSSSGALALALAHDRPLLLSGPVAETLRAPELLGAPADPADLAARLRTLLTDPRSRDRLGAASRSLNSGRSWPEVARRHLSVYEEVLDGRSNRREA